MSCEEEFLYAQVFPVLLLLSSLVTWQINSKHWQHYDNSLFTCPFYTYIITKPCAKTSRIKLHFTKLSKITCGLLNHVAHPHWCSRYNTSCCGPYRNDTISPSTKSQHLLEENFSRATHWRKEDDRAPDAFRPGVIQRPNFAVVIIHDNLNATNMTKSHC